EENDDEGRLATERHQALGELLAEFLGLARRTGDDRMDASVRGPPTPVRSDAGHPDGASELALETPDERVDHVHRVGPPTTILDEHDLVARVASFAVRGAGQPTAEYRRELLVERGIRGQQVDECAVLEHEEPALRRDLDRRGPRCARDERHLP